MVSGIVSTTGVTMNEATDSTQLEPMAAPVRSWPDPDQTRGPSDAAVLITPDVSAPSEEAERAVRRKGDDLVLAQGRAAGLSVKDASLLAGLSERHGRRRLAEPSVTRLVEEYRAERRAAVASKLEHAADRAVETLVDLLGSAQPSVQHAAARSILTLGPHAFERTELEARIRELETLADQMADPGTLPAVGFGWPA